MEARKLLDALHVAEKLKDETRHCTTTKGAPENVASHSWRMALMAYFMTDEFPALDMDKVIKMCLIHDLGECFTGDIPTFQKTQADEDREAQMLGDWVKNLPEPYASEMAALYAEMDALETPEAKLYKSIDKLEAVIQRIADFYVGAARIRAEPDICDRYCSVFGLSKGAAGGNSKGYERQNCGGEVTTQLFYASNLHL